jgi:hypothetical protein
MGVDKVAASAGELDLLRDAGADVRLVRLARSPVFDNREVGGVRDQHCLEPGDPLPVAALPDAWRVASDWVVAGRGSPDEWASVPDEAAHVALGWQGLLRDLSTGGLVARRAPGPSPLLWRADVIVVSRLDLEPGTRIGPLGALLRPGATLFVTDGTAGGECWTVVGRQASLARHYEAILSHGPRRDRAGDASAGPAARLTPARTCRPARRRSPPCRRDGSQRRGPGVLGVRPRGHRRTSRQLVRPD